MTSVPATEKVWCTIRRSSASGTFCGTGSRAARSAATLGHSACTTWQSSSSCVPAGCVRQSSFMRGQHARVEGERDEPPDGERHVRQRRARCLRRWPHRQARVCRREPEGARKRTGEPLPVAERAVESGDEPEAALLRRRDKRPAAHAQHDPRYHPSIIHTSMNSSGSKTGAFAMQIGLRRCQKRQKRKTRGAVEHSHAKGEEGGWRGAGGIFASSITHSACFARASCLYHVRPRVFNAQLFERRLQLRDRVEPKHSPKLLAILFVRELSALLLQNSVRCSFRKAA